MAKAKRSCYDAALNMLSRRGYAVKEIAGKLKEKGYEGFEIAEVINDLEDQNFLNDEKFAQQRTRYRAEVSRWGRKRIEQELKQKGVAEHVIDAALENLQEPEDEKFETPHDFQETATDLLLRRFGAWPADLYLDQSHEEFVDKQLLYKKIEKEYSKRMNFLLRRGFSLKEAKTALEESKKET